jgi:hypothetical protein
VGEDVLSKDNISNRFRTGGSSERGLGRRTKMQMKGLLAKDRAESGRREKREEPKISEDKFPQVICFKCGEAGHYSSACNKPKVCFICYSKDHVVDGCPEWKKSQTAAQFYGSANKGLGFYHIDVAPRGGRFRHWSGFDNFGVFTIEEGDLSEEEVVQTLKSQIDKDWHWKLMKMEEFRYLVKFPPHIKVESKVLGKATFFYLKNDEVMASLRVWDGDIEPVGRLTETWVQIRGVPPRWTDWITIKEIASSLGKLSEVDWQTLFSSFFRVIRVKINCKNPKMIPDKRVMEMDDNLFMIYFAVEGLEQEEGSPKGDEDKGEGDEGDVEEDGNSLDQEPEGEGEEKKGEDETNKDKDNPGRMEGAGEKTTPRTRQAVEHRVSSVKRALLFMDEKLEKGEMLGGTGKSDWVNLLQAMEVGEFEDEMEMEVEANHEGEEEMLTLPEEWVYDSSLISGESSGQRQFMTESAKEGAAIERLEEGTDSVRGDEGVRRKDNSEIAVKGVCAGKEGKTNKKQAWGPVMPQRKSQRTMGDSRTIMEKAQEAKRKWEGEVTKGKQNTSRLHITSHDLKTTADVIGIVSLDGNPVSTALTRSLQEAEEKIESSFSSSCSSHLCSAAPENSSSQESNIGQGLVSVDVEDRYMNNQQGVEVVRLDGTNRREARKTKYIGK